MNIVNISQIILLNTLCFMCVTRRDNCNTSRDEGLALKIFRFHDSDSQALVLIHFRSPFDLLRY